MELALSLYEPGNTHFSNGSKQNEEEVRQLVS
jgi:hypothetical protein